jgi:gamma-glutamyltranspeptidase/glutathione hydrolase
MPESAFLRKGKAMKKTRVVVVIILAVCENIFGYDRITGLPFASRSEVIACNGMAATSQPLATQAAIDILKKGGNAIDAAIAADAMLGLVEPVSCGIGGDLFAIVWDAKTKKLYGLNASGRSPYSLTIEYFRQNNIEKIPPLGPLPVTAPGCVDGWFELHKKFGKLSMKETLAPAIRYAREGFPVTELIANYWQRSANTLSKYPNFAEIYMPAGRAPAKGEIFRNPHLADTLEKIAKKGRDVFYKGEIAKKIVDYMQKNDGFLSRRDLAEHKSEWIEPVSTNYRGYDVWELPPNCQGIAVLQMLNILEGFDLKSKGFGSVEHLHYFIEAKKIVYEDRARYYADPDFNKIPVRQLISKEYAAKRRQLIDVNSAGTDFEPGNSDSETSDTIYLTVADRYGNMVSLIQSNYRGMGSGMTPDGLGFILQDRGELFNLQDGFLNSYAPHKRPFHTIMPGFITKDGQPFVSFGVMGGDMQPQGQVQIIINLIDFGMNLQEAGDAPRIQHNGSTDPTGTAKQDGGLVSVETGFPPQTIEALKNMGHKIDKTNEDFGGYQAIMFDSKNKVFYGASESRKDGQAAGY